MRRRSATIVQIQYAAHQRELKRTPHYSYTDKCTTCYSTRMIPFRVEFRPGGTIYEQIVYAATKAMMAGQLRPGDAFPSVRTLSKELKINPNTAHKAVAHLVSTGLLEIRPGFGTIVSQRPVASRAEKTKLLQEQFEQLVVEGKRLGIELDDMQEAIAQHWKRLSKLSARKTESDAGGRGE